MKLSIKNVSFGWAETPLFRNVRCELNSGDIVRLDGENGAGKSTLLKLISGMIPHFELGQLLQGDIYLEKKSIFENPPKSFFPQLAYIPGKNIDFFLLTENLPDEITFTSSILRLTREQINLRLNDFITIFPGFEKSLEQPFSKMSFSQKVLSLTCIYFLQNGRLFLFDEVMNGFTSEEVHQWQRFFVHLKNDNKAVIYIDHQTTGSDYQKWSLVDGTLEVSHA